MVLLEYKCTSCGKIFSELVKNSEVVLRCPDCGGETVRNYSGEMYSATGKTSHNCSGNCANCKGCG